MFNQIKKNAIRAFMLCSTVVLCVEKSEAATFLDAIRNRGAQGNNVTDVTAENVSAVTKQNDRKIEALFMSAQLTPNDVLSVQNFSEKCAGLFDLLKKDLGLSDDEARQKIYDKIYGKIKITPEFVNYLIKITVNSKVTFSSNTDTSASSKPKYYAQSTQRAGLAMDANAIGSAINNLKKTGISLDAKESNGSDDNKSSGSGSDDNKSSPLQKITLKKTEPYGQKLYGTDTPEQNQLNQNVKRKPVPSSPYSDVKKVPNTPYGSEYSDSTVPPEKAPDLNGASNNQLQNYGSRTQNYEQLNSPSYSSYVKNVINTPYRSKYSYSGDLLEDSDLF